LKVRARPLQFPRDKLKLSSKTLRMLCRLGVSASLISAASAFAITPINTSSELIISVRDQKLLLVQNGAKVATYPVSTSMFGLGDDRGRMTTPLGYLAVEKKIGDNVPVGAVFHNRRLTGEVLQPDAPGRDPITTRIIWLRGLEAQNAHAFQRCIYIHGTPEEKKIGQPASYGCIRMKSSDVAALYDRVPVGALVQIVPDRLPKVAKGQLLPPPPAIVAATTPPPQVETQNRDRLPKLTKVAKAPHVKSTSTVVAATMLVAPPEHLSLNQPEAQSAAHKTEPTETAGALTAEQMRMAGGLAAQRQKAKLALGKRL
jgi:lipoprotein-anchoring transpeptidase ErfK/SrfK